MPGDNPSNYADAEVEPEDDAAPVKKGKKSRKSKGGKKHVHNDTDNADESNVPNMDTEDAATNRSQSEEQPQYGIAADAHATKPMPRADSEPNTVSADGNGPNSDPQTPSSSFSNTEGSTASSSRGMEKLLRGIFVEPIVHAGAVAKDAGETAMKPVKQVAP
jgi:hypothetical protein